MNRRELVKAVAAHGELDPKAVDTTLRNLTDVITAVVAKGEPVNISGFAKFVKVDRPARTGRNPATGEPMKFKATKKARITPLKGFKDSVMKPSQAPKLAKGVWPPSGANTSTKATAKKAAPKKAAPKKAAAKKATATKAASRKAPAKKAAKRA
ncbi:MAG TPA: HU family DNA-binding protein [Acidimicrobiales bacterium]|nr:HU family DNA-binding protein [Acidimicrobiales bacterium]